MSSYTDTPRWEDSDERLYEQRVRPPSFSSLVDGLMANGLDRDEAEARATEILEDDAA